MRFLLCNFAVKKAMQEIWIDVKDFIGLYQVSNRGRVRSLDKYVKCGYGRVRLFPGRILRPAKDKGGYLQVTLCKEGKTTRCYIHRLVADAFLPNPENLPEVNHINEDKTDNCVENLEWCTRKYNANYGTGAQRSAKKQSRPVLQYTPDGEFVKEWPSMKECNRNGFHQFRVWLCCNGKGNKHKGYIWRYKNA